MNKILLIVDPQYDFISGSLKCEDAYEKMMNLVRHLKDNADMYDKIVITLDWHPTNHCSFVENGGEWPKHCVEYTQGAAVFQPILDAIPNNKKICFLTKGTDADVEEYSIMKNLHGNLTLKSIILNDIHSEINVCGVANEYCVKNTVNDLVKEGFGDKITILSECIACVATQEPLLKFAKDNNLKVK